MRDQLDFYLQVDPRVDRTWSAYAYTEHNPVHRVDRDGRESLWQQIKDPIACGIGVGLVAVGAATGIGAEDGEGTRPCPEDEQDLWGRCEERRDAPTAGQKRVGSSIVGLIGAAIATETCSDLDEDFEWVDDAWDCIFHGECDTPSGCTGPACSLGIPPLHKSPFIVPGAWNSPCSGANDGARQPFNQFGQPQQPDPDCVRPEPVPTIDKVWSGKWGW